MLRKLFPCTILIVVLGTTSCCFIGTQMNTIGFADDIVPQLCPFGGTALDIIIASHGPGNDGMGIACAMDIPFSFVADVAMLPITVPYTLLNPPSVGRTLQIEDLERTPQTKKTPEIDNEMRQELNDVAEPWNKGPTDERPEHPPVPIEESLDGLPPG